MWCRLKAPTAAGLVPLTLLFLRRNSWGGGEGTGQGRSALEERDFVLNFFLLMSTLIIHFFKINNVPNRTDFFKFFFYLIKNNLFLKYTVL